MARKHEFTASDAVRIMRALTDPERGWDEGLEAVVQIRQAVEILTEKAVANARAEGITWASIGEMLGMTRQGAQQRYGAVKAS